MSVYEEFGGEDAVAEAVDAFYARLVSDPETSKFFQSADIEQLRSLQRMFLTAALGGPDAYEGRDMRAAHAHLQLTEADFDQFLDYLAETLAELGFEPERITDVIGRLSPLRVEIVSAPAADGNEWDDVGGRG